MGLSIHQSTRESHSVFSAALAFLEGEGKIPLAKEFEAVDNCFIAGILVGSIAMTIGLIGCRRNGQSHLLVRRAFQAGTGRVMPQKNFFASIDGLMVFGGGMVAWGALFAILYRGIVSNQYGWMKTSK